MPRHRPRPPKTPPVPEKGVRPREMAADLLLAVLEVIDHELAQEGPAALHAEQVARTELERIRALP